MVMRGRAEGADAAFRRQRDGLAPATPVVVKTVDEDDAKDSNDVTDAMKTGNEVVVDPILIEGADGRGPTPGEGSWGIFGRVADAIGKTIAGAGAGEDAPVPPTAARHRRHVDQHIGPFRQGRGRCVSVRSSSGVSRGPCASCA
jgi:hypothetical protein